MTFYGIRYDGADHWPDEDNDLVFPGGHYLHVSYVGESGVRSAVDQWKRTSDDTTSVAIIRTVGVEVIPDPLPTDLGTIISALVPGTPPRRVRLVRTRPDITGTRVWMELSGNDFPCYWSSSQLDDVKILLDGKNIT